MEPPKKVIQAIVDFKSRSHVELSFSKGDFFYVTGREDDEDFYQVTNPLKGVRGYVPVKYFKVLETRAMKINKMKSQVQISSNNTSPDQPSITSKSSFISLNDSSPSSRSPFSLPSKTPFSSNLNSSDSKKSPSEPFFHQLSHSNSKPSKNKYKLSLLPFLDLESVFKHSSPDSTTPKSTAVPSPPSPADQHSSQPVFGIVVEDFFASSRDELFVTRNEKVRILAQNSNNWLLIEIISKPFLTGLVPSSCIAIIDPSTNSLHQNPKAFFSKHNLYIPTVDDWSSSSSNKTLTDFYDRSENNTSSSTHIDSDCASSSASVSNLALGSTKRSSSNQNSYNSTSSATTFSDLPSVNSRNHPATNMVKSYTCTDLSSSDHHSPTCLCCRSIVKISVTSFIWKNGSFLFTSKISLSDNTTCQVHKSFDSYLQLFKDASIQFPSLSSLYASLSSKNSSSSFMNNSIASKRLDDIKHFIDSASKLCPPFLFSPLLTNFLGLQNVNSSSTYSLQSLNFSKLASRTETLPTNFNDSFVSNSSPKSSSSAQVKVKVNCQGDIVVFKLPITCPLNSLIQRIESKLFTSDFETKSFKLFARVAYNNKIGKPIDTQLTNDSELYHALSSAINDKLFISVVY
ncbi:hypothetical protein BB560_004705 [Smittium megazygosporum]|uniref:SH3 domain-containing protein n=2 Tax=Smittium megazygosporum TaxID=133381 RepID=A0A2T9Z8P5_9FUNG|nr:hypothetical protein BB560_004705 [Smittium megazygosporum]